MLSSSHCLADGRWQSQQQWQKWSNTEQKFSKGCNWHGRQFVLCLTIPFEPTLFDICCKQFSWNGVQVTMSLPTTIWIQDHNCWLPSLFHHPGSHSWQGDSLAGTGQSRKKVNVAFQHCGCSNIGHLSASSRNEQNDSQMTRSDCQFLWCVIDMLHFSFGKVTKEHRVAQKGFATLPMLPLAIKWAVGVGKIVWKTLAQFFTCKSLHNKIVQEPGTPPTHWSKCKTQQHGTLIIHCVILKWTLLSSEINGRRPLVLALWHCLGHSPFGAFGTDFESSVPKRCALKYPYNGGKSRTQTPWDFATRIKNQIQSPHDLRCQNSSIWVVVSITPSLVCFESLSVISPHLFTDGRSYLVGF